METKCLNEEERDKFFTEVMNELDKLGLNDLIDMAILGGVRPVLFSQMLAYEILKCEMFKIEPTEAANTIYKAILKANETVLSTKGDTKH